MPLCVPDRRATTTKRPGMKREREKKKVAGRWMESMERSGGHNGYKRSAYKRTQIAREACHVAAA